MGLQHFQGKKKKILHPDLWVLSWSYCKALMYGFQAMNRTSTAFLKCSWNGLIETLELQFCNHATRNNQRLPLPRNGNKVMSAPLADKSL